MAYGGEFLDDLGISKVVEPSPYVRSSKSSIMGYTKQGLSPVALDRSDLDSYEVYVVVAKPMSFKIFAAISAAKDWPIHHVDIMTAFLYAELKEPIEIELPEGLRDQYPNDIDLLMKTIYGLTKPLADFNCDGDIYPSRWPIGDPVVIWAHGLPFIPVFSVY
ncbi:hypothetical protein N7527_009486 [Penicillium freii]|nr:hypothetical protein N7527_009486 [Penicillium freii]